MRCVCRFQATCPHHHHSIIIIYLKGPPAELENLLISHTDIANAAVIP
ncbi:hypothetical protein Pint_02938 [Pistacia integerrima]|uniref:Uncharacterized protein n=1 Tax=Pistacia integerrima TaxID=434235 RepID=A0ACC0ZQ01_9ROSI|nr:hypothetical protein Pint_02938 [Pistacia integerrima]